MKHPYVPPESEEPVTSLGRQADLLQIISWKNSTPKLTMHKKKSKMLIYNRLQKQYSVFNCPLHCSAYKNSRELMADSYI